MTMQRSKEATVRRNAIFIRRRNALCVNAFANIAFLTGFQKGRNTRFFRSKQGLFAPQTSLV